MLKIETAFFLPTNGYKSKESDHVLVVDMHFHCEEIFVDSAIKKMDTGIIHVVLAWIVTYTWLPATATPGLSWMVLLRLGIKHYLFLEGVPAYWYIGKLFSGWSWKLVPAGTKEQHRHTEAKHWTLWRMAHRKWAPAFGNIGCNSAQDCCV